MGSHLVHWGGSHRFPENVALLLAHQPGRAPVGDLSPGSGGLVLGERLARPRHCGKQYPRHAHEIQLGNNGTLFTRNSADYARNSSSSGPI